MGILRRAERAGTVCRLLMAARLRMATTSGFSQALRRGKWRRQNPSGLSDSWRQPCTACGGVKQEGV